MQIKYINNSGELSILGNDGGKYIEISLSEQELEVTQREKFYQTHIEKFRTLTTN